MKHNDLKKKALNNSAVRDEYDSLEPEFTLLREILKARQEQGLSQAEVAKRMGTKSPAITRFESSLTSGMHSPSISTVKKYAKALDCHLEMRLVQNGDKYPELENDLMACREKSDDVEKRLNDYFKG
jgi:transcriptional regulator with XRE-family HTH domain